MWKERGNGGIVFWRNNADGRESCLVVQVGGMREKSREKDRR